MRHSFGHCAVRFRGNIAKKITRVMRRTIKDIKTEMLVMHLRFYAIVIIYAIVIKRIDILPKSITIRSFFDIFSL